MIGYIFMSNTPILVKSLKGIGDRIEDMKGHSLLNCSITSPSPVRCTDVCVFAQ